MNNKQLNNKIFWLKFFLPIFLTLLYFLAVKNVLPFVAYSFIAIATAFFFFPVSLFFPKQKIELAYAVMHIVFSVVISLSVVLLVYVPDTLKTVNKIIGLILFILSWIFYFTRKDSLFALCFAFLFLTVAIN